MANPGAIIGALSTAASVAVVIIITDWILNSVENDYSITGYGTPETLLRLFL